jgi:hypothetical protein
MSINHPFTEILISFHQTLKTFLTSKFSQIIRNELNFAFFKVILFMQNADFIVVNSV